MTLRKLAAAIALLFALVAEPAFAQPSPAAAPPPPVTILVSIDGFRPDYLDRGVTPNLLALARSGVRAAMRPSFPSKTFPNHYAMVTGLRPDKNGIVANNMTDDAIPGVKFAMSNTLAVLDRRWWDEAEPIWVTAEKAKILTGTVSWPGSEAPIHGLWPKHWAHFDQSFSSDLRVDMLMAWMALPAETRPQFATLYFDIVDYAGHHFGPDSPQVTAAAAKVDAAIGRLQAGLAARGIVANLVIVSDHGMAALSDDRRIFIDDLLDKDAYSALELGPIGSIYPNPGHEAEVARVLTAPHPHFQCWRKADIPERLHYGHNPRVAPVFCLSEVGWSLTTHDYHPREPSLGDHGYDNAAPEMRATFIAAGPAFRHGVSLPTFDNVDVYPLLAKLIGVTPQPNDGTLTDLAPALTN
ncbi:ectonucleotide pyrophosphatase/phosphodiesterase [Phenylobacterium sp.]|uniref:alkaline phosphatase family protein n=1 Tax=Phenylobacterium sp. TaxID=1871053 RepID=UPI002B8852E8|nr:ectonucleotide pyrophosphatase/phosphodiesterase [Phenylobacterium sp.]HLZ77547.1 ectonucleotide pyrophosphatase/phosphodiesterase [Phenylobacterium sp.]